MDLQEIEKAIYELENDRETTFANCQKLANLYVVIEHLRPQEQEVEDDTVKEYDDILPQYRLYCETKRRYQMNEISENALMQSVQNVCREIKEFLYTIYSNTDMQAERSMLIKTLTDLITELTE